MLPPARSLLILSGHPWFQQPTLNAVVQWKFQPMLVNGEQKPFVTTVGVNFNFEEQSRGVISSSLNSIEGRAIRIADLIKDLSVRSDRPVIDRTDLKGLHNFEMKWSLEDSFPGSPTNPPSPAVGRTMNFPPAFFTAIQEQLGLRLESAKAPVDFIVITSVQKP